MWGGAARGFVHMSPHVWADFCSKDRVLVVHMWRRAEHPGALSVPYRIYHVNYGHFRQFLRRCALDMPCLKHVILFVDITSFDDAVMSSMTSQHCTCIGHVTIYYKRTTNTSVRGIFSQFVGSLG